MRITIDNADQNDVNELAKLARAGKINTFRVTCDEKPQGEAVTKIGVCLCNTCKSNGTWTCNGCSCFNKYEER